VICEPCGENKHCGKPGEVTPSCTCQHHPRKFKNSNLTFVPPEPGESPFVLNVLKEGVHGG